MPEDHGARAGGDGKEDPINLPEDQGAELEVGHSLQDLPEDHGAGAGRAGLGASLGTVYALSTASLPGDPETRDENKEEEGAIEVQPHVLYTLCTTLDTPSGPKGQAGGPGGYKGDNIVKNIYTGLIMNNQDVQILRQQINNRPLSEWTALTDHSKKKDMARTRLRQCRIGTWRLMGDQDWKLMREIRRLETIYEDPKSTWMDQHDASDFEVAHAGLDWTREVGGLETLNHVLGALADIDISVSLLPRLVTRCEDTWDDRKSEKFCAMMRPKCTKIMKGKLRIEVFRSNLDSVCEGEVLEEFTGERSCHQT